MSKPKVSILMTVRNGERFIGHAVQSVLDQTFSDFELVLVDDGSTDGSMKVVAEFSDPRIVTISTTGIGRTPALNMGLAATRGEYVAVLDADDISLPERLEKQVAFLDANPKVAMAGASAIFIDEEGQEEERFNPPTSFRDIYEVMPIYNPFAHSAVMYRRSVAEAVGGYPEEFAYAQDFALYQQFLGQYEVVNLSDCLVYIRRHGSQMTVGEDFSDDLLHDGGTLLARARKFPGMPRDVCAKGRRENFWMDSGYVKRLLGRKEFRKAANYVLRRVAAEPFASETWTLVALLFGGNKTST